MPANHCTKAWLECQASISTEQELPYATTVIVDGFEEGAKLTRIGATIYCEREGQKAILIGKRGAMLKKIGSSARMQIERVLAAQVFLELRVKVEPNWRESRSFVEELDWRRQLEHLAETTSVEEYKTGNNSYGGKRIKVLPPIR